VAMGTLDSGSSLLAQLTLHLIGINRGTGIGSSHHPGSEIVGGKILSTLQWDLTWRLALQTNDGPAARRGCVKLGDQFSSSSYSSIEMVMATLQLESASWSWSSLRDLAA